MKCGCKPSKLDGHEKEFKAPAGLKLPESYTYERNLPPIWNQGNTNMCVTFGVSAALDWRINTHGKPNKTDNKIDRKSIYECRSSKPKDDGMTIKEALSFLRFTGVKTSDGVKKIREYAKVGSEIAMKTALINNGPLIIALPVYDNSGVEKFWEGGSYLGGHCVAIVGYDKNGFIIRNSWGPSYGVKGYGRLPYSDVKLIKECWTIL